MDTLRHRGREVAYEHTDRGADGPPVVFVHGAGGSRSVWAHQRRLADRFPVVAVDLSGHGASGDVDADPGYTTLAAYADDVEAVAEAVDALAVVGVSLGGAVVLHLLIEREHPFESAVVVGTGARMGVLEDLLDWLREDFDRAIDFLHGEGRLFADPEPELVDRSEETMRETGRRVTERDFLTCHEFDVRNDLEGVDVPLLALYGEDDRLTPPWFHEFIVENVPDGRLVGVEDAAHLPMLERPSAFNDAVLEFLDATVG